MHTYCVTVRIQSGIATLQAMSKMVEALRRDMEEETEARQVEAEMRATAQERCAAAEEQASKLEWEYNQAAAALQRKVSIQASWQHALLLQ